VHGYGLLIVKFKVNGVKYEIIFDENLEVYSSDCGGHLEESAEFYKTGGGCTLSMSAPKDWIFMHIFEPSRKIDADGSSPAGAGSDQCGERS
jgi:hypothetical protein